MANWQQDLTTFQRVIVPVVILINVIVGLFMLFTLPDDAIGIPNKLNQFTAVLNATNTNTAVSTS